MSSSYMFVALVLIRLFSSVEANAFLSKGTAAGGKLASLDKAVVEERLLQEVRGFVGKGIMDDQIPVIRTSLMPMWLSLPKNALGNLDNSQVHYVLHRYFVQRHGWNIEGLDRAADNQEESSTAAILRGRVPGFIMERLEEAFGSSGLKLHELVIVAATLEHFIHDEATERLKAAYEALELSTDGYLNDDEADTVLDVYMYAFLLGQDKLKTNGSIQQKLASLEKRYHGWADTKLWLRDVRGTVEHLRQGSHNPFVANKGISFHEMDHVAEEVSERFGQFQNGECWHLKDVLLVGEDAETGLVPLDDFYRVGVESGLRLTETPEYLRSQGALEESKTGVPRVIIPNFVLSKGNCMGSTGFYSICCINECESLLAQVERAVAAPQATASELIAIISRLSTSTEEYVNGVPEHLARRLEDVAAKNGGYVAVHGRLLAQWLHFAFPLECPYPHMSGSTNPLTSAEWKKQTSQSHTLDDHAISQYVGSASDMQEDDSEDEAEKAVTRDSVLEHRWIEEEEILFQPSVLSKKSWGASIGRLMLKATMGLGVMVGLGLAFSELAKRGCGVEGPLGASKPHMV